MTNTPSDRPGFTLMEIMVALLIGAAIITVGRTLFDTAMNAQRSLRSRVGTTGAYRVARYEIQRAIRTGRASDSIPFVGSASKVSFAGWCPDGYGGLSRCAVRISTQPFLSIIELRENGSEHEWVADSADGRLDFVVDAGGLEPTVSAWESTSIMPSAIRWISRPSRTGSSDTLLFAVLRNAP